MGNGFNFLAMNTPGSRAGFNRRVESADSVVGIVSGFLRSVLVQGAADGEAASVEDMGIDHCGFDVFVAEEFLDGADVVAILQQVGGEGVAKGMGADALGDASLAGGLFDGFVQTAGVEVRAAQHSE